jgi:hypothetical protein
MPGDGSFRVRYRNGFDNAPYAQANEWVLFDKKISSRAYRTYLALVRIGMWKPECDPSQKVLAKSLGVGIRAIQSHINELSSLGLVTVERRDMNSTNEYILEPESSVYGSEDGSLGEGIWHRCWSPFMNDSDKPTDAVAEDAPSKSSPNDDSVKAGVAALSAASKAREAAKKKSKERAKKRMQKQTKKAASKVNASEAKRAADGINTRGMERIWKNALSDHFPDVTPNRWTGKERKLLKDLMFDHPKETVTRAMVYMCENWDDLCKRWKRTGVPSIGTLFGYRADIFSDIETGGKYTKIRRMDDSYGRVPSTGKGGRDGW